jgi:hypothetical protein
VVTEEEPIAEEPAVEEVVPEVPTVMPSTGAGHLNLPLSFWFAAVMLLGVEAVSLLRKKNS